MIARLFLFLLAPALCVGADASRPYFGEIGRAHV